MKLTFDQTITADVVIAGAGYAGIKAAYECIAEGLSVLLVVRSKVCSGSSFYPLMVGCGCLSPKDEADKELFAEELNYVGLGINDPKMSETFVENIADRVTEMQDMGFPVSKLLGRKACFALRDRDIFMWNDFTGIKKRVRKNFSDMPGLTIMEQSDLVYIASKDKKVRGAVVTGSDSRLYYIKTNNVILATGGFCSLYKNNTNTEDTLGLGQVLAYEAGARLINLEFVQFLPCFITPSYNTLVPETSLMFAQRLQDTSGNDILSQYLPEGITPKQCFISRSGHGPFTSVDYSKYFDIATMNQIEKTGRQDSVELVFSPEILDSDNPAIQMQVKNMLKQHTDPIKDRLTIAIFGNSSNGGVFINENAKTDVEGLFAAGEVSGGLHGADRVGGLASGSCFVFGKKAAQSAAYHLHADYLDENKVLSDFSDMLYENPAGSISPRDAIASVKEIMDKSANVMRTESGLKTGLDAVKELESSFSAGQSAQSGQSLSSCVAARSALKMAGFVLTAMLERKESRGAHYRDDFPDRNDEDFGFRIALGKQDSGTAIEHI